jgi:hypothetical protein
MGAVMPEFLGRRDPAQVREQLVRALEDAVPETVA